MASKFVVWLIGIYQKTISPDHGWMARFFPSGYCPYTPSCSQYTKQAVDKYGVIRGGWLGIKRIARCNPLTKGGVDELPND